jgi:ubiquinone/menaquinone biosynthesis C-methylase UbiE
MEVPCQKEAYYHALNTLVREGDKVLDVGMGLGYGMHILSVKAGEVHGVDVDKKAVAWVRRELLGKNPKIKQVSTYDGYKLPYKDGEFDVITCVDVLEHVEDYDKFIDELLRVSRRYVMFSTPNRRPEFTNPDGSPKNHWHLREWTKPELAKILSGHPASVKWRFIDGPFEGPFTMSSQVSDKTLVLLPVLQKTN